MFFSSDLTPETLSTEIKEASELINSQLPNILDDHNSKNPLKSSSLSNIDSPQTRKYSSKSSSCSTVNADLSQDRAQNINVTVNVGLPPNGALPENPYGSDTLKVCETVEPRPLSKPEEYVIYKSMNFLPITTRYNMLRNGTKLKVVDVNPRQAVQITDTHPPEFSQKKW